MPFSDYLICAMAKKMGIDVGREYSEYQREINALDPNEENK